MNHAPAIILWDVDGTLLRRAGPHHRMALVEAIHQTTGLLTSNSHIPTQGMLDTDILWWMLREAGTPEQDIRHHLPEIILRAQQIYLDLCPDLTGRCCPCIRELLEDLRLAAVRSGLVTGNLTQIGWQKMEKAGLRKYFDFGAFAEMASTRAGLVRIARWEATNRGWIGPRTRIWLIGDHPNDIKAARLNAVRVLAVGTGLLEVASLQQCDPDESAVDLCGITAGHFL